MEYVAPVNGDPNDPLRPYQDGDPTLGQAGSIPSARFFNLLMSEGRNLVEGAGLTLDAQDDAQWLAAVQTLIAGSVSAGAVMSFAMQSAPQGWLKANGAAVSRTTYANLFAAIGTTYGTGDGATTFNVPDLRGEFIRGWDDGRGVDAGRGFGGAQDCALENIVGSLRASWNGDHAVLDDLTGAFASAGKTTKGNVPEHSSGELTDSVASFDASRVARTADETRPRNVAMLACIKY